MACLTKKELYHILCLYIKFWGGLYMKKVFALLACIMTICTISFTCFARVTFGYKWKSTRAKSYSKTVITSVDGTGLFDSYYRVRQVRASSSGKNKGGKTNTYACSGSCGKNVSVTDEEDPAGNTFHDTSIKDKMDPRWYGMSCYMTGNYTTTHTRKIPNASGN